MEQQSDVVKIALSLKPKITYHLCGKFRFLLQRGETTIEDLFQDFLLWVVKAKHQYNPKKSAPNTWVYTALHSFCATRLHQANDTKRAVNLHTQSTTDQEWLLKSRSFKPSEFTESDVIKLFDNASPLAKTVAKLIVDQPLEYREFILNYFKRPTRNVVYDPTNPLWVTRFLRSRGMRLKHNAVRDVLAKMQTHVGQAFA